MDVLNIDTILDKFAKLQEAELKARSRKHCLRLWSEFIRERDGHRCVDCHSQQNLSAHHICRKTLRIEAQLFTGNGITLCGTCHRETHRHFNGRPDPTKPIDAQGGEKLASMERLYSILLDDALERKLLREDFYYLSDDLICVFKSWQGVHQATEFPGSRLEQAYLILAECEFNVRRALLSANGFPMVDEPILPSGLYLVLEDNSGKPSETLIAQNYLTRSKPSS